MSHPEILLLFLPIFYYCRDLTERKIRSDVKRIKEIPAHSLEKITRYRILRQLKQCDDGCYRIK